MGLGISLVMSVYNRTHLFHLSYPTWFEGTDDDGNPFQMTWPDEILIVNDGGEAGLEQAAQQMANKYSIPVTYKYREKGHHMWTNPAVPHNWLVKEAKYPVVAIIDPEIAFINDGLPIVAEYFAEEANRINSLSAGSCYSIQTEFMHVAGHLTPQQIKGSPYVSSDPTTHQVIVRGGPAHGYRAWWRDHYLEIGGKDERYLGWGFEDLDLAHRNMRFCGGMDWADSRIEIVEYGHGMPWGTCPHPTESNRQLWQHHSPPDGVANLGIEWGIIP